MEMIYDISYWREDVGDFGTTQYTCSDEVEAALWFQAEFADELGGYVDRDGLDIQLVGFQFEDPHGNPVEYFGGFDPSGAFCEVKWTYEDIMQCMVDREIPLNDENIARAVKGIDEEISDASIELGWSVVERRVMSAI